MFIHLKSSPADLGAAPSATQPQRAVNASYAQVCEIPATIDAALQITNLGSRNHGENGMETLVRSYQATTPLTLAALIDLAERNIAGRSVS